ncbi:tetratricopeptide repeat protein [Bradyrhizobium sp.]|uniref:tetratricopeptide repeat-containing glycosyltransferase family protein n=1 Tax=Bradyrhizobium sp. TaxID=376 RepID=UPI003C344ADB
MKSHERRAAAQKSKATSDGASRPARLYQAGMRHLQAGRQLDAQICCQQALAVDPNHADTFHLMGLLALQAQQYDLAAEWFARAIRQGPKPQYLLSLGAVLRQQGRLEEALKAVDEAVQLKPDDACAWKQLGDVLADVKRGEQALASYQQALRLNPGDWEAAEKTGCLLSQLGRLEEALGYLRLSDQLQPNSAATLQMCALVLYTLKRFEEALTEIRKAQALDPADLDICNNLGVFLQRLGRHEEALSWFDRALEIRPDFITAFTNKAYSLTYLHRFAEAFAVYDASSIVAPGNAEVAWSRALLQLLTGNFEAGWLGREARWKVPSLTIARLDTPQPLWLGKGPIAGKTILILTDEGFGDAIQFARYVPMVAALGARVILVVSDALWPLFSGLAGVAQCLPLSVAKLPSFDMYCPISSLPLAFATRLETIPSTTPYLPAPAKSRLQVWEDRLGPHDKLRVGLAWSGNPNHKDDHNRSLPLSALAPILDCDATFVSLQKDLRPDDAPFLRQRSDIVDLTAHLTDFAATAALVSCLDLVISVDSAVAHLAGALARPTWIILPSTPDYRWLLDRDDSPWYPTARLFRQSDSSGYGRLIERARAELSGWIAVWSEQARDQRG